MGFLVIASFCFMFVSYLFLNVVYINNNKEISSDMSESVAKSKVSYFDTHDSGRLINRFSNDIGVLDHSMIYSLEENNTVLGILIVIIVNIVQIKFYFSFLILIMAVCIFAYYQYFSQTKIMVKQLDLRLKTPIFKKLTEVIQGLKVIQVFGNQR